MKIILHIGRPKTGTTAIQLSMLRARDNLLTHGILVPKTKDFPQFQHFAALLCTKPENIPRYLSHWMFDGPEAALAASEASWNEMLGQIEEHRPEVLFLSSEHFWKDRVREGSRSLVDMLRPLSSDITIVGYVRDPANLFLSDYQQWMKGWGLPMQVDAVTDRGVIESFEAEFGQEITLLPFDREQLYQGDVVQDFVRRFVQSFLPDGVDIPTHSENQSVSATSLALCEEYVPWVYPEHDAHFPLDLRTLRVAIDQVEQETGTYQRPVLNPEIGRQIIRASTELLWLRDTRGIVFPGIDYDGIDGQHGDLIGRTDLKVADVMDVDPELVSRIRTLTIRRLIDDKVASDRRVKTLTADLDRAKKAQAAETEKLRLTEEKLARANAMAIRKPKAPWYVRRYRRLKKRGKALIDLTLRWRSGS